MRVGICLSLLVACTFGGCGENDQVKQKKRMEQAAKVEQETRAQERHQELRRQEVEAEVRLLSDASTAPQAIESRLREWITRRGGLLVIRDEWSRAGVQPKRANWHSMPSGTPWFVGCGLGGISVTLGEWMGISGEQGDSISGGAVFGLRLSRARFSEEQCKELVVLVGQKMLAVTKNEP